MARPTVVFARTNEEDEARIEALSKAWGPVAPLNRSQVVIEALKRACREEMLEPAPSPGKKSRKASVGA